MRIFSSFRKGILAAAVAAGSMMFALAASASTAISLGTGDAGTTWSVDFANSDVSGTGIFTLNSISGNVWNFALTISNSVGSVSGSRLVSLGFNANPDAAISIASGDTSGWDAGSGQGAVSTELCVWDGNNCNGGGNGGLLPGQSVAIAFNLTTGSLTDTLVMDHFGVKFQSVNGSSVELPGTISTVPLPATGVLLIGGLGGLAALKRRRKSAA